MSPVRHSVALGLLIAACCASPAAAQPLAQTPSAAGSPEAAQPVDRIFRGLNPRSVADLKAMEARQRELAARVVPCTVAIRVGPAHGSGVLISSEGYVLTAAHVAQTPDRRAEVILHDGRRVAGRTLGMNRGLDAGLVKLTDPPPDGKAWPYVRMGSSETVRAGQWCVVSGHPGGFQEDRPPVFRVGRVLSADGKVIVTDCPLIGGDSGGPLLDMQGRVIGIHSRIGSALTANMHVPVNAYSDDWEMLVDGQVWGPVQRGAPYIGVSGRRDGQARGARIDTVKPGGPGEAAGLRPGDVVLVFDGRPVEDFNALVKLVGKSHPGRTIDLRVRRGDQMLDIQIKIGRKR